MADVCYRPLLDASDTGVASVVRCLRECANLLTRTLRLPSPEMTRLVEVTSPNGSRGA